MSMRASTPAPEIAASTTRPDVLGARHEPQQTTVRRAILDIPAVAQLPTASSEVIGSLGPSVGASDEDEWHGHPASSSAMRRAAW